jgi:hypothetical protein
MLRTAIAAIGVAALLTASAGTAVAGGTPVQKCAAAKRKAAGKKEAGKMSCYSKAAAKNVAVDPNCLLKVEAKFSAAFAKAGVICGGTAPAAESAVDTCVSMLVGAIPGSDKCPAAKLKAAGKAAGAELSCWAKSVTKSGILAACIAKSDAKLTAALTKAGACTGDFPTLKPILDDDCALPLADSLSNCCSSQRIVTTTNATGIMQVDSYATFAVPVPVSVTLDTGVADGACRHDAIVPTGGFTAPAVCITALGYTARLTPVGCAVGAADGKGTVWDGNAGCPDANVDKVGDTHDGSCDSTPIGSCSTADVGNNSLGDVDTFRGDIFCDAVHGLVSQFDVPVQLQVWVDAAGCPGNGVYSAGEGDALVSTNQIILSPTTGFSTATFTDKNGDSCAGAGAGPVAQGPYAGTPATGPCCTPGQATTFVATGLVFSGAAPLYDYSFNLTLPGSVTSCSAWPGPASCTLTADACAD